MTHRRIAPTVGAHPAPARAAAADTTVPQRQPGVRVAGWIEIASGNGRNPRFRLYDLAPGAFRFEAVGQVFSPGERLRGSLEIVADGVSVTLFATFDVRSHDRVSGRVECRFVELGPQETSALRYLVAARLNGRPVLASELLRPPK